MATGTAPVKTESASKGEEADVLCGVPCPPFGGAVASHGPHRGNDDCWAPHCGCACTCKVPPLAALTCAARPRARVVHVVLAPAADAGEAGHGTRKRRTSEDEHGARDAAGAAGKRPRAHGAEVSAGR